MTLNYMLDHSPVLLGLASLIVVAAIALLWLLGRRRGGPRPRR